MLPENELPLFERPAAATVIAPPAGNMKWHVLLCN